MTDPDRLSLLDLVDRWHAHARDDDPEQHEARRDLETRLATLRGFAVGVTWAMPPRAVAGLLEKIDGRP